MTALLRVCLQLLLKCLGSQTAWTLAIVLIRESIEHLLIPALSKVSPQAEAATNQILLSLMRVQGLPLQQQIPALQVMPISQVPPQQLPANVEQVLSQVIQSMGVSHICDLSRVAQTMQTPIQIT